MEPSQSATNSGRKKYSSGNQDAEDQLRTSSSSSSSSSSEEEHQKVPPSVFPNHDCKIGHNIDLFKAFMPGETFRKRITRNLKRTVYLDQTSALSREVFRSDTAMKREISRHISFHSTTIHPFSYLRFCWECIMIATFATAFIVLPYDVVFLYHPDEYESLSWFHVIVLIIDLICLIDICFSIRTGYCKRKSQEVILDARTIANRYVVFWFWIDLISSVPTPLFTHSIISKNGYHNSFIECLTKQEYHFSCFWDFLKVLSLLKMLRLRTFLRYINNVFRRLKLRRNIMKITTIGTVIVVAQHWTTCVMFLVPRLVQGTDEELIDPQSWTVKEEVWDDTPIIRYLHSFFRTIYLLVGVTHSVDNFMTQEDILLDLVSVILGYVLKIYILAELLIFIRIMSSSISMYHEHRHDLQNYINHEQLPKLLETRMLQYYNYRLANLYSRESMIDRATGEQFIPAIRENRCGAMINQVSLFRDTLPSEVAHKLMMALRYQLYLKDDLIVNADHATSNAKMVFVLRGTVAIYTSNWREVLHLEDGEHFGEYQLVLNGLDMKYSNIVAVESSEVFVLAATDYKEVLSHYPEIRENIYLLAQERYEKLVTLETNIVMDTIAEAETIRRTKKIY
ncbi:potassium/sodium hyperpolarization-activated cyclic nucleotide-gated channel 1-like [Topomyia yanbarensis]|uniref:potassium/sodium hyperpolarization-activated cyclic nucleotide-gated channel 1-like n=1 Tax=Topomyia yanbarensis TaxID=2498891 RepID=UPI00273A9BCF|nr:potassium/sodium hyperpolarization-activated cyclic nucleotide-gated channel 1-like [Topomyia yanbarensis]